MKIKFIRYCNWVEIPHHKHYNDAGLDVYNICDTYIPPHKSCNCGLGFGLELPDTLCAITLPRSSQASNGIIVPSTLIDAGYRGEIHVQIYNHTDKPIMYKKGERIGQLLILPYYQVDLIEGSLGEERGEAGFGSTGK